MSSQHPDRRPRKWRLTEPVQLSFGNALLPLYEESIAVGEEPTTVSINAIADVLTQELEWFLAGRRLDLG